MKVFIYTWNSDSTSKTLEPEEIDKLFQVSYELMLQGELSNGRYQGANRMIYWERVPYDSAS